MLGQQMLDTEKTVCYGPICRMADEPLHSAHEGKFFENLSVKT